MLDKIVLCGLEDDSVKSLFYETQPRFLYLVLDGFKEVGSNGNIFVLADPKLSDEVDVVVQRSQNQYYHALVESRRKH